MKRIRLAVPEDAAAIARVHVASWRSTYRGLLLEAHQGRGIGRMLVDHVVDRFRAQGYGSMRVWVLDGNPAEAFYQRLGGQRVGTQTLTIGNADYLEVAYGWSDLGSYG